jgi:uncharacterized protein YbjT (DUF2867 family)
VLSGPRSLSQREQVATLGKLLGRPIAIETVPADAARVTMLERIPEPYVEMLLGQWEEETKKAAWVTTEVERVTGTPATPYEDALAWTLADREA